MVPLSSLPNFVLSDTFDIDRLKRQVVALFLSQAESPFLYSIVARPYCSTVINQLITLMHYATDVVNQGPDICL